MSGGRRGLQNAAAEFGGRLEAVGFQKVAERAWRGDIVAVLDDGSTASKQHIVTIGDEYPFEPPKVRPDPPFSSPRWHAEPNGQLCLYRTAEGVGRPWEDPSALIDKVEEWYGQSHSGWPADPGDLDLERYFVGTVSNVLVAFDDLDRLVGRHLEVREPKDGVVVVSPSRSLDPARRRKKGERSADRKDKVWAAGVDLGHLDRPVADWRGVLARLSAAERTALRRLASTRSTGYVVARYSRSTGGTVHTGALGLRVTKGPEKPAVIGVQVENRQQARANRSGPDAEQLRGKSVALVGVGAVGSFLAERLARSGVGSLTLIDGDRMRYGNSARHLAGERFVGDYKPDAVKAVLVETGLMTSADVVAVNEYLSTEMAVDIIGGHDLVVDATASSRAAGRLEHVAGQVGEEWVKVALYRRGAVIRLDRLGPGTSRPTRRLPPVTALDDDEGVPEAGCGDPVSPTPPVAVEHAATLACEYVIDTLLRDRRHRHHGDSLVEVRQPNPAAPGDLYADVGRVVEERR